jgi:hypothetical protein
MPLRIVLLGAGFSRNWGGWLAAELIGELCSRLLDRPHIVEMLRRMSNFEEVFGMRREAAQRGGGGNQPAEDVRRLESAIGEVFFEMNMAFAKHPEFEFSHDAAYSVVGFLAKFDAIFTLNQDLLLELNYDGMELRNPGLWTGYYLPGIQMTEAWRGAGRQQRVSQTLTVADRFELQGGSQPVFKLHGSTNWRSAGGAPVMVIGTGKQTMIEADALLRWYFEQFKEYLYAGGTKLMTIGYSFSDAHVNNLLVDAGAKTGCSLYLVDPRGTAVLQPHPEGAVRGRSPFDDMPLLGVSMRPLNATFGGDEISHASFRRFIGR